MVKVCICENSFVTATQQQRYKGCQKVATSGK